ncbi:MAG: glycosyltransferase family protein [Nitriliruptorales bacterium]
MADPSRSRLFGIVGTFDVANFGDLLFPDLARAELGRRLGEVEVRPYSYRRMDADRWPHAVRPIDDLAAELDELGGLLLGGGHLVRFDQHVAPGYAPPWQALDHPTGYWLAPALLAAAAGVPTVWNAVGASPGTPEWARGLLRAVLDAAALVTVRDSAGQRALLELDAATDVHVVPDTAWGIGDLLAVRNVDPAEVARRHGLDGPYVVVQPSARLRPLRDQLAAAVRHLSDAGVATLELPISPTAGDGPATLDLDAEVVRPDGWPPPLEVAALIAGADLVVGRSMHLTIVATASGVPAVVPADDTRLEELRRFGSVVDLAPDADWTEAILDARGRRDPGGEVAEVVAQLAGHWERVTAALRDADPDAVRARQVAFRRELVHMPAELRRLAERARDSERIADELGRLESEVARLRDAVSQTERQLRRTSEELEQTEARRESAAERADREKREKELAERRAERLEEDLEKLHERKVVKVGLAVAEALRPAVRALKRFGGEGLRRRKDEEEWVYEPATEEEERELRDELVATLPDVTRTSGPLVSIVILTRNGRHHLRRLMPALEQRTVYDDLEVIVVDNGSEDGSVEYLGELRPRFRLEVIENEENRSFSEANNQGVAASRGELLLFLNNDIEPIVPGWLGRMVDTLEARDAAAVGARLIYPRRPGLDNVGDVTHPDLTIQHRGIHFVTDRDGIPRGRNVGPGEEPTSADAAATVDMPAVTAACTLVRRDLFDQVGGFSDGYVYGTEDVDLCMKLREAGGRIVYDGQAALWHHEFGTQNEAGREWKRRNRIRNRELFVDRWGPRIYREVLVDKLRGERAWSQDPLHVAITVTKNDPSAGFGDWYTAHELGDALLGFGYRVSYPERYDDRWYDLDDDIDVIVSLLDGFDLHRVPEHVVRVAWIRNWTDRWIERDWFEDYDLVLASSLISKEIVERETAKAAHVFPLATNPSRFSPATEEPQLRCDLLFVGNHWDQPRAVDHALPVVAEDVDVRLHGRGWDKVAELRRLHHGPIDYDRLPAAYSSARIVLDDTAAHAKPYGAVNSRVFDALSCGTLVVTDNVEGIHDLFDDDFPTWTDGESLDAAVQQILDHPEDSKRLVQRYRSKVVAEHTYERRAGQLRDILLDWATAPRVGLLIGVPQRRQVGQWGDYHYARAMQRQLERRGHPVRVHLLPSWAEPVSAREDVTIHLFGLSEHRTRPGQLNVLWNISHPELVTPELVERYDLAFTASDRFAAEFADKLTVPLTVLHQCTDPERFRPEPGGPHHELVFVGNSRRVRRRIIDDLTPTPHDLAVYGRDWTRDLVDPKYVKGELIPNRVLNRHYSAADIVLNDHWDDMREWGFLSNRLYDALACGAFVVSDHVDGIEEEFDGAVVTYRDPMELREGIARYLADPDARKEKAERGRKIVLERHTFAHRIDTILGAVGPLVRARPGYVAEERLTS